MSKNRDQFDSSVSDPFESRARAATKWAVQVKRTRGISKTSDLKLPHEHDEAADIGISPTPDESMKQAVVDIARGVQDTDRGAAVGSTYTSLKRR